MEALWFIIRNNIKKKKRDVGVLVFLITLAALLLYTSISVFAGLDGVLDRIYDRANTSDMLYISGQCEEQVREIFLEQEEVAEYESSECLFFANVDYSGGKDEEIKQSMFILSRIDEERTISKLIGAENAAVQEDSILLPYYMKSTGEFDAGDPFYLTVGERKYAFTVSGFAEDPMFATPLNVSAYSCYVSSARMDEMLRENDMARASRAVWHRVRLKEGSSDSIVFEHKITQILTEELPELGNSMNIGMNWITMSGGCGMLSRISMGVMLVFSMLLIAVALIIVRFSIHNFMEMNRKNTGILQAAGYTTKQMGLCVMLEMSLITFTASFLGILLGLLGSSLVGSIQGVMIGLRWNQRFHAGAAVVTMAGLLVMVACAAWLCGRAYRRTPVLDALRDGISAHNFKRNHFPFEKSRLPKALVLAGKNLFGEKGKTLSVFCIVTLLAFSMCAGFGLYENFAVRKDNLLKIVGLETGDIMVTGEDVEKAGEMIAGWDDVESVLYHGNTSIHIESADAETEVTCDYWRDPQALRNEAMVEGRLPEFENEIVVTTNIAKRLNVRVGDTVYLTESGERLAYVICGIDQKMNNMGLKAMMSENGMRRLNQDIEFVEIYCYLEEGVTVEEMSARILGMFEGLSVADSEKMIDNTMKSIVSVMKMICILFVLITLFVVVLVEVLLIKSKLIRERREFGIQKAIGFTTAQLIVQTMLINLPVIGAGALLGVVLSGFLFEPFVIIALSFCGIKQANSVISPGWMFITIAGILLVALAASFLASVRIRKIEPVSMLTEE